MDWLRQLMCRLIAPLRRKDLDTQMVAEMRLHLDLRTKANIDAGMPPEEARCAARRQFGGIDQIQEVCRDQRGILWIEQLMQDLRHALRTLAGAPALTTVAVMSLALGIGANTAIFSLLNAILLRSLPVHKAHELRVVNWVGRNASVSYYTGSGMGKMRNGFIYTGSFSYPGYLDFRDRGAGFTEVFAFFPLSNITMIACGQASNVGGLMVSGNFFRGYGAQTLIGRPLAAADDQPVAVPAAVITYRCWERLFSLDPNVLGQSVTLNKNAFTIIGVLPRGFAGPLLGDPADVYIPISSQPQMAPGYPLSSPKHWWVQIMVRIAPGASASQAQASLEHLFRQALSASDNRIEQPGILLEDGSRGPLLARRRAGPTLWLLQAVVALVILIACANLASLLLARGAAQRHEMSVRAAIGAGRGRLIRQQLTESLVIALAGGGLGLALAVWLKAVILGFFTAGAPGNLRFDLRTDANVLAFTLGLSVLTAVLFGLIPALRSTCVDPAAGLKDHSALGAPRLRLGKILVSAQVGLSMLLVFTAGLLVQTFANLRHVEPGFNPDNLLLFRLDAGQAGYKGPQLTEYFEGARRSLAAIPDVKAVAFSDLALVSGSKSTNGISILGRPAKPNEEHQAMQLIVSDSFFSTMGMGLVLGRDFSRTDTGVAIVNETFARSLFPSEYALGKSFQVGSDGYRIVGVCRDAKYDNLRDNIQPTMYLPYRQHPAGAVFFEVRSVLPAGSLASAVRKAVSALDPDIPLANLTTQRDLLENSIALERLFASLCSFLALLAALLSYIGLYGLMAYNVARRTSEIGIRMALGARSQDVARPILREAILLAIAGAAVGLPAALALGEVIRSNLFDIQPYDPTTMIGGVALLLSIAVFAAWIPARRAARTDPLAALRCE
jgi:predicted permease